MVRVPSHRHVVLLVEDDTDTREAYVAMAETVDLDMITVASGHEALRRLRDGLRPCLILLDMAMSDMDGLAFRRVQLADPALVDIPIVVISGGGPTVEAAARKLGLTTFLQKPVEPADVFRLFSVHCSDRARPAYN